MVWTYVYCVLSRGAGVLQGKVAGSLKLQCKQAKSITQVQGTVCSGLRYCATRTAIVCAYHLMLHYDYARWIAHYMIALLAAYQVCPRSNVWHKRTKAGQRTFPTMDYPSCILYMLQLPIMRHRIHILARLSCYLRQLNWMRCARRKWNFDLIRLFSAQ